MKSAVHSFLVLEPTGSCLRSPKRSRWPRSGTGRRPSPGRAWCDGSRPSLLVKNPKEGFLVILLDCHSDPSLPFPPASVTARRVIYSFWCLIRPIPVVPSSLYSTPKRPVFLFLAIAPESSFSASGFVFFIFHISYFFAVCRRSENVGGSSIKLSKKRHQFCCACFWYCSG